MTPDQLANLRMALTAIGLVPTTATDADVQTAWAQYQTSNPSGAATISQQIGLSQPFPWLVVLGIAGGALAVYLIWASSRRKKIDGFEYPDPAVEDAGARLRGMSRALEPLHSMGSYRPRKKSCRKPAMGRLGAGTTKHDDKYEFEPEARLDGYRKRRAR